MPYQSKPRLAAWRTLMERNLWLQQFGQSDDSLTNNGATGCTDTVLQAIILGAKGRRVTHDAIRKAAGRGYASRNTGLTATDVKEVITKYGLPYRVAYGLSFADVLAKSNRGPVFIAIRYGDWPNWAHWAGVTRPKPWARPTDKAGRNQFTGFFGAHAALLLGYAKMLDSSGATVRTDAFVKEPNHGSPARPTKPPYDIVLTSDAKRAYDAYRTKLGRSLYCAYPTRDINVA